MVANFNTAEPDVILIGAGIMSATLGTMFKEHEEGELELGTELVVAEDKPIVALLGASHVASAAAFIAVAVLEKCFAKNWRPEAEGKRTDLWHRSKNGRSCNP